jgi:hypothetical protein
MTAQIEANHMKLLAKAARDLVERGGVVANTMQKNHSYWPAGIGDLWTANLRFGLVADGRGDFWTPNLYPLIRAPIVQ